MRVILRALVAILLMTYALAAAAQQAWPARPVRIIAGFTPGSALDIAARLIAPRLGEALGQSVIVENRAGASSNIAAEYVARSPADGYTLMVGGVANAVNVTLSKGLTFDFLADFAAISGIASLPTALVVHPSMQASNVSEFIGVVKSKPGAYLYGSSGNGTAPHLSGELFNLMAGVKLVHVPYKSSPPAVADLLAGRVAVMFAPVSSVLQHVKAGTLRGLATTGTTRSAVMPDLPTVAEAGLPGFDTSIWLALYAPAATPANIVERLYQETQRALGNADVRAQFAGQGMDVMIGTRAALDEFTRSEVTKWATVIREAQVKVN